MHLARKVLLTSRAQKFFVFTFVLNYMVLFDTKLCYCFPVVDVVPTGQIKSKRLSSYLEEDENRKRKGESLLKEAKRMRLASLTPSVVGIFFCQY